MAYAPPVGRPPGPPTQHPPSALKQEPKQPSRTYGWFKECEWCFATLCALVGVTAVATMVVLKESR